MKVFRWRKKKDVTKLKVHEADFIKSAQVSGTPYFTTAGFTTAGQYILLMAFDSVGSVKAEMLVSFSGGLREAFQGFFFHCDVRTEGHLRISSCFSGLRRTFLL